MFDVVRNCLPQWAPQLPLPVIGSSQDLLQNAATSPEKSRSSLLLLQTLVTIVLCYQLLFSPEAILAGDAQNVLILLLLLICGSLIVLPDRLIGSQWFPGSLVLLDTAITTGLIYLSGNASSDFYLAYFLIILITSSSRAYRAMFLFLSLVCMVYGIVLYQEFVETGQLLQHHLIRLPFLLIMGVFYTQSAQSMRQLANYDVLTGLPNRRRFLELVDQVLIQAVRTKRSLALLFLDLDSFKLINETLGHAAGDQVLQTVAARLRSTIQDGDVAARLGGDEFVVLARGASSADDAARLAQTILTVMDPALTISNQEIFVTTSIGIALYPQDGNEAGALIKHAEAALYRAKTQGSNRYQFYSEEMNDQASERFVLETSLRKAVDRQELLVYYQPQVDLATGQMVGVEALVRWRHPNLGLVSPAKFIPVAETAGLIISIDEWVLRTACRQVKAWHNQGLPLVRLSVNLSSRCFHQPNLVPMVTNALLETQLPPRYLELELTESCMMQDIDQAVKTLGELRALGLTVSLDDFGTGYSSLSYLRSFPIDTLKIDRVFIQGLTASPDADAIVTAILAMAHALKLKVIAEGVETEEQLAFLNKQGCDEVQGYLYSQPLPAEELQALIRNWPHGSLPIRSHAAIRI